MRNPLRPLIRILHAREAGIDPDLVESDEKFKRLRKKMLFEKTKARQRILLLTGAFVCTFLLIAAQMFILASNTPNLSSARKNPSLNNTRIKIVDRYGVVLATNIKTYSLYAHPQEIIDKEKVARSLVQIFPELYEDKLLEKLKNKKTKFIWIQKKLSPEQREKVNDLGQPGLYFGPRQVRLYPNGSFASHVLGGTTFGREAVDSAELIGQAGVELSYNNYLINPQNDNLALTIDSSIQGIVEKVLGDGIKIMNAKGGSAILIDANTGELFSLVSLPDFDPNNRPNLPISGDPSNSPLFNRAAQGVYELGSTFKIFTAAQIFDQGIASEDTIINIKGPLYFGKYSINDHHYLGEELTVADVMIKSSNIGTARLAAMIGAEKQKEFLKSLGLLDLTGIELPEASRAKPQFPRKWSKISTATVSYGHGISVSPLHLAAAYSTIVNGGRKVAPTIIKNLNKIGEQNQIISPHTSAKLQEILSKVVEEGTARNASLTEYTIGGKTGTAEKVNFDTPGYIKDKVITTFVACFPMENPKYVLVVTLDEPEDWSIDKPMRTAGWTAVPVATEIIKRIAPVLGLQPNSVATKKSIETSIIKISD